MLFNSFILFQYIFIFLNHLAWIHYLSRSLYKVKSGAYKLKFVSYICFNGTQWKIYTLGRYWYKSGKHYSHERNVSHWYLPLISYCPKPQGKSYDCRLTLVHYKTWLYYSIIVPLWHTSMCVPHSILPMLITFAFRKMLLKPFSEPVFALSICDRERGNWHNSNEESIFNIF